MKVNDSVSSAERPRLSRQCEEILALLRLRKRTNRELAVVALKYTSRVSEVREHLEQYEGETIRCRKLGDGLTEYAIERLPEPAQRDLDLLDMA